MANLIADHKKGDTWDGMSFLCEELQEDGITLLPVNLTDVEVLIQFKVSESGSPVFEFKTADNTITIPNPLTGELFMMPRKMDVYANKYMFDLQLTYADGSVQTIASDFWEIKNDISR